MIMVTLNLQIDTNKYPDCVPGIEKATALVQAGRTPQITIKGVPFSIKSKEPFRTYRARIYELYRDPSYGFVSALHEASHAIVLEEDGIPNIRLSGPGILYDKGSRNLFPYGAKIDHDEPPILDLDMVKIFNSTIRMAVGGVAVELYAGIKESTNDDGDYKVFSQNYDRLPEAVRVDSAGTFWKKAQDAGKTRLAVPETKSKVFIPQYLDKLYAA